MENEGTWKKRRLKSSDMLRELTVCIFIPSFKGKGVQADQLVMRKRIANSHKKTISHWSEESLLDCPCSFIEKKK